MKSILYTVNSSFIGGAERVLMQTVLNLPANRFRPFVVSGASGKDLDTELGALPMRYEQISMPAPNWRKPLPFLVSVARIASSMAKNSIKILHSNDVTAYRAASIAARLLRIPRICHIHFCYDASLLRWALRYGFEYVIIPSESMKSHIQKECPNLFPDYRCFVIHNGFTPPNPPKNEQLDQLRETLGIARGQQIIGFIGQVIPIKGIKEFLLMAKNIDALNQNIVFLIVGDDKQQGKNYRIEMENLSKSLGLSSKCIFTGFRTDVWELLHICDLVVMPSYAEPFGLVALEVGAAGKPIIASNVGGLREIIINGDTGFLVQPQNVEALTQVASCLLQNRELRYKIGETARQHIVSNFHIDNYIASLINIYNNID